MKPGVGRWQPPEAHPWARALHWLRVGLAAGAGELPTTFRFESSRFWFPVALGAMYLFSSPLARARGGCWGAECGVQGAAFAFTELRLGRCRTKWVAGREAGRVCLPLWQSSLKARERGSDPGPTAPGCPSCQCPLPTPGSLPTILAQTIWGRGRCGRTQLQLGALSLGGVQVRKSCRSGRGGAELSPLSTYLEGTAEESSGVIP